MYGRIETVIPELCEEAFHSDFRNDLCNKNHD